MFLSHALCVAFIKCIWFKEVFVGGFNPQSDPSAISRLSVFIIFPKPRGLRSGLWGPQTGLRALTGPRGWVPYRVLSVWFGPGGGPSNQHLQQNSEGVTFMNPVLVCVHPVSNSAMLGFMHNTLGEPYKSGG